MAEFRGGEVVAVPMPVRPDMVVWALPGPMGDIPYTEVENLVEAEVGANRDHMDAVKASVDQSQAHIDQTAGHVDSQAAAAAGSADVATSKALQASGSASTATTKASEASVSASDAGVFRDQAEGFATSADADAATATAQAGIATDKAGEAAESALTLSQRVDVGAKEIAYTSDGKPYLLPEEEVEELYYRVDKSVGTRVFVGDTMIHGETGWRRIDGLLSPSFTADFTDGQLLVKRTNSFVTVRMFIKQVSAISDVNVRLFSLPAGFVPSNLYGGAGSVRRGLDLVPLGNILERHNINSIGFTKWGSSTGEVCTGELIMHTNDLWPTSLPGTPA